MERVHETHVNKFVSKRLTSVKTALRLLRHELEVGGADGRTVTLDRSVIDDAVSALELFVDDYEQATGKIQPVERREVNGAKPAAARIK